MTYLSKKHYITQ